MKLDAVISSVPVFKIIKMDYLKKLAPNRCRVMIFKQGFNLKMRYIHINDRFGNLHSVYYCVF